MSDSFTKPAVAPRASPWFARWLPALPPNARVLDFASGSGRNVPLYHGADRRSVVIDRDPLALDNAVRGAIERAGHETGEPSRTGARTQWRLDARLADLEAAPWPLPRGAFDAVLVGNYLFRPRLALLADLLAPGGLLLYETFALGQASFGRPTRPDFLLRPGELLDVCRRAGLQVIAFEDGLTGAVPSAASAQASSLASSIAPRRARVQRVCAVRPPVDAYRFGLDAGLDAEVGPDVG